MTIHRVSRDTKAARIEKELEWIRLRIKEAGTDTYVEGLMGREALQFLLDAHDTFPTVLDGLSKDFNKVVEALKEAAALMRKGRP